MFLLNNYLPKAKEVGTERVMLHNILINHTPWFPTRTKVKQPCTALKRFLQHNAALGYYGLAHCRVCGSVRASEHRTRKTDVQFLNPLTPRSIS